MPCSHPVYPALVRASGALREARGFWGSHPWGQSSLMPEVKVVHCWGCNAWSCSLSCALSLSNAAPSSCKILVAWIVWTYYPIIHLHFTLLNPKVVIEIKPKDWGDSSGAIIEDSLCPPMQCLGSIDPRLYKTRFCRCWWEVEYNDHIEE